MKKPNFVSRGIAALEVFRHGYPQGSKAMDVPWPAWRKLQPQWHLMDLTSYVNQGFTLNSLVYSVVMYKVRAVIPAPLRAYKGDPDYPELLSPRHALSKLVAQPNEHQSWTEFQSLNIVYLNVAGNVYIYKDRAKRMMYSLRPDRVFIVPDDKHEQTISHYLYVPEGQSAMSGGVLKKGTTTYPMIPEDVIHVKLPYPLDPLEGAGYGLSPMSSCAQSIDVDNMVTSFLKVFFDKGAMLTGLLTFDLPLKETVVSTIIERWSKKYGGYEKWGVGVLDRGGKYQRVGLTFDEMGFNELDSRNETRVLGPFGVPPILIGTRVGLERSTYSNYEGARKAVWEDTLLPEMRLFEVEYQRHLKSRDAFVKFDTSQVPALQKDLPVLVSAAYTLVQMGVPSNQALAAVGLRIGKVPGGDVPFIVSGQGQQQGPRVDAEDDDWGQRMLAGGNGRGVLELIEG